MRKLSLLIFLLAVVAVQSAAFGVCPTTCAGFTKISEPYDSGYFNCTRVVQESVIKSTKYRTNKTESPYKWTISYEETHRHAWAVTGEAETTIKTGMLTKIIADGAVKVTVGGNFSGSDEYKWTVTDELSLGYCKRYKFECFIDTVNASAQRETGDFNFTCSDCYPGNPLPLMVRNRKICGGSANGQDNEDGGFEHISNYTQPDPCLDCPPGYHD